MTYAQFGLIEATDYNNLAGTDPTTTAGAINRVWGIGNGDAGYGQTAVSQVSVGNTVSAAQWASLINATNNARRHQSTSYSSLGTPVSGDIITFLSTLQTRINDAYTNRLPTRFIGDIFGSSLSATSTKTITLNAVSGVAATGSTVFTVTFGSIDQARYFFNVGGWVEILRTSFTNTNGTSRSASIGTLTGTYCSGRYWAARQSAKYGSGGTVNVNQTVGFYSFNTISLNLFDQVYQTGTYSSDYVQIFASSSGGAGSNNGNGNVLTITYQANSGTTGSSGGSPADDINCSLNITCRVWAPNSGFISNSWGTITIA